MPSLFLVDFNCFKFEFSSNISIDLLQIQTFKLLNYSLTSHFRGLDSQLSLENFGVPGPGSHLKGPETRVIVKMSQVSGITWGSRVTGLGSHFSGVPLNCTVFLYFLVTNPCAVTLKHS